MTDALKEQLSAFLDGALPGEESELLMRRLCTESELGRYAGRYWLIGEALRECRQLSAGGPSRQFAARVCAALAAEEAHSVAAARVLEGPSVPVAPAEIHRSHLPDRPPSTRGWVRRTVGLSMAASAGAVVVLVWQATHVPVQRAAADLRTVAAANETTAASAEPAVLPAGRPANDAERGDGASRAAPSGQNSATSQQARGPRLADYVMAHSEYSSPLGRRAMLSGILAEDGDAQGVQDVNYVERVR